MSNPENRLVKEGRWSAKTFSFHLPYGSVQYRHGTRGRVGAESTSTLTIVIALTGEVSGRFADVVDGVFVVGLDSRLV